MLLPGFVKYDIHAKIVEYRQIVCVCQVFKQLNALVRLVVDARHIEEAKIQWLNITFSLENLRPNYRFVG